VGLQVGGYDQRFISQTAGRLHLLTQTALDIFQRYSAKGFTK
jgi:hypothetical protein